MDPKYPMPPPRSFSPGRPFVGRRPHLQPSDGPTPGHGPGRHDRSHDTEVDEEPPARQPAAVLAVDVGGTKFAVGIVTPQGELIDRTLVLIDQDASSESHFRALAEIIEQQRLEAVDRHRVRLVAVGVGSAGPITPNCETVSPINLPAWREFPLRGRLRQLTDLPVFGDLDGKALALAEGWHGAAKGLLNYCVLTVSTGIGGGVVIDGQLLGGATGNAGHLGHVIVEPHGRRCPCGARGCVEAEASGLAVEAITGRSPTEPTYEIMQRTGRYVGRAAAQLCNTLDLDLVVVGGSVALGFAATFFNAAQEELSSNARTNYTRQSRITPTRLGENGPLIGAAAVGIRGLQRARAARAGEQGRTAG